VPRPRGLNYLYSMDHGPRYSVSEYPLPGQKSFRSNPRYERFGGRQHVGARRGRRPSLPHDRLAPSAKRVSRSEPVSGDRPRGPAKTTSNDSPGTLSTRRARKADGMFYLDPRAIFPPRFFLRSRTRRGGRYDARGLSSRVRRRILVEYLDRAGLLPREVLPRPDFRVISSCHRRGKPRLARSSRPRRRVDSRRFFATITQSASPASEHLPDPTLTRRL